MKAPGKDDEAHDAEDYADRARAQSGSQQQGQEKRVKDVEVLLNSERPINARAVRDGVAGIEEQDIVIGEVQKLSRQSRAGYATGQQPRICQPVRDRQGDE